MSATITTLLLAAALLAASSDAAAQEPSRAEVLKELRKAAEFYRTKVSTEGGYHFYYTADLSYGRSEHEEGFTQVTVQREGIPSVGMAYLEAYDATGDRYYLDLARDAAYSLVKGQHCSGGWDYVIEFDPAKRKYYPYRADGNCGTLPTPPPGVVRSRPVTNLDDNVSQAAARLMMRVDRALGFADAKIHEATLYALDSLIKAQYPNGAWPQRYHEFPDPAKFPVKRASYPESWSRKWPGPNYESQYTFNDNTISDAIDAFLEAAVIYKEPRYQAAAERGGDFMLLAQMPEPQPAWAQQYDVDMHPAWARIFEPPSVTGGESQGVMKTLLLLYRATGKRKYLDAIPRALEYLQRSALPPVNHPVEARRRMSADSIVLARFYELRTNKPLYITKGTRVQVQGRATTLIDGYEISYDDRSVITHYGVLTGGNLLASIADEYKTLSASGARHPGRPEKLHGLSPWSGERAVRPKSARAIIDALDERGAWVEDGNIGKADNVVSVFAAKDMTLTIGGRAYPVAENETVSLFQGRQPPPARIIRSSTFSANVVALSAWLSK
jgi:hypothetical protein